jgi:hypothetical protein
MPSYTWTTLSTPYIPNITHSHAGNHPAHAYRTRTPFVELHRADIYLATHPNTYEPSRRSSSQPPFKFKSSFIRAHPAQTLSRMSFGGGSVGRITTIESEIKIGIQNEGGGE